MKGRPYMIYNNTVLSSVTMIFVIVLYQFGCDSKREHVIKSSEKITTIKTAPVFSEEDKVKLILEHKRRIKIILNNVFKAENLVPINQVNQNDLEETMNDINVKIDKNDRPQWIYDSWEIVSRLNPRGGWYSKVLTDYDSIHDEIITLENEFKEKREEFTTASKFYLKRQFSENEWELVVMENKFIGKAVFRSSQEEVKKLRLEGRIISGVVLKNLGKEPFKMNAYSAYGPVGSSTEYFYVYELGDYDFKQNQNKIVTLRRDLEINKNILNEAERNIKNAYINLIKTNDFLKGE